METYPSVFPHFNLQSDTSQKEKSLHLYPWQSLKLLQYLSHVLNKHV